MFTPDQYQALSLQKKIEYNQGILYSAGIDFDAIFGRLDDLFPQYESDWTLESLHREFEVSVSELKKPSQFIIAQKDDSIAVDESWYEWSEATRVDYMGLTYAQAVSPDFPEARLKILESIVQTFSRSNPNDSFPVTASRIVAEFVQMDSNGEPDAFEYETVAVFVNMQDVFGDQSAIFRLSLQNALMRHPEEVDDNLLRTTGLIA